MFWKSSPDPEILEVGNPPISVKLRRNKRARRLTLRLGENGPVLTLPVRCPLSEAQTFLEKSHGWLMKNISSRPEKEVPRIGGTVLFEGELLPLLPGSGRSAKRVEGGIAVEGDPDKVVKRLKAFMIAAARARLMAESTSAAEALGVDFARVSLRDTRSRWGSCSSEGNLMYSWRLIMAPPEVLAYVARHEVSHRLEMNHSPEFWAHVARICPSYKQDRAWLRKNGPTLHRYVF
jgi:predicted metal-dependent hydrolase